MLRVPDIIAMLEQTERRIAKFIALDDAVHRRSYAPGKWSALEILGHVSDTDAAFYYRFLAISSEAGAKLVSFDEKVWAKELCIDQRPAVVSFSVIRGVHEGLVHHLRTLPKETIERSSMHPEHGELSGHRIASVTAQHTLHHLNQLEAIRDGRSWSRDDAIDYWH